MTLRQFRLVACLSILLFPLAASRANASCPGDLTGSGNVGVSDLLAMLACWGGSPSSECAAADLNGDDVIGVSDLLALLAAWGPCPNTGTPEFEEMDYDESNVTLELLGIENHATLNGTIAVTADGQGSGTLAVVFNDGTNVTINVAPAPASDSIVSVTTARGNVIIPESGLGMLVNGVFMHDTNVLALLHANLNNPALNPADYSVSTQAVLAIVALGSTPGWANNVAANAAMYDQEGGGAGDQPCKPNWMCRNVRYIVGAAFAIGGQLACSSVCTGLSLGLGAVACQAIGYACALGAYASSEYMGYLAEQFVCACGPKGSCCTIPVGWQPPGPWECRSYHEKSCAALPSAAFAAGRSCQGGECDIGYCGTSDPPCSATVRIGCDHQSFYFPIMCASFANCLCAFQNFCNFPCD